MGQSWTMQDHGESIRYIQADPIKTMSIGPMYKSKEKKKGIFLSWKG